MLISKDDLNYKEAFVKEGRGFFFYFPCFHNGKLRSFLFLTSDLTRKQKFDIMQIIALKTKREFSIGIEKLRGLKTEKGATACNLHFWRCTKVFLTL